MKRYILFTLIISGFIVVSSCNLPVSTSPDIEAPGVALLTDTPQTAESIFGPGTFTLALPAGWDVIGPDLISWESGSYDLWRLGPDPSSSGGPGTSHVIIADPGVWKPEALMLAQCSTCPPPEFEGVTIDGQPALRAQLGGGGVPLMITWHFIEHNGKLIAFTIHDPETLEPLNDVIESIKLQ